MREKERTNRCNERDKEGGGSLERQKWRGKEKEK